MGGLLLPSLINSQTFNLLFIIELMTIQDLLVEAYEDTNTSIANYPYTKGLKKLNEIYSEMYRMIVTTQEDYFWTYWTTDIQEWAREYKVEREWTTLLDDSWNPVLDDQWNEIKVPWIEKVKKVIIWTDEENSYELPELSDLEESNGMKWWKLKDNHIFLNWTPEKDIENWLEIQWIQNINPVEATDNEVDAIFPWHSDLKQFHKVLMDWLRAELWEHKQDFEKSDRAKARYEEWLEKMKRYISQRVQSIYYSDVQN